MTSRMHVCVLRLILYFSLGEYAALVVAGVIDLASGLKLVAYRAKLMMQLCELRTTSMLAVSTGAATVSGLIQTDKNLQGLAIACNNSQSDCVVGGRASQLEQFKERIRSAFSVKSKALDVPLAYHTEAMDPILEELTKYAQGIVLMTPKIPIVSNVFGRVITNGEEVFTPEYFALHCRQTVLFDEGIQDLLRSNIVDATSKWVEIGPHPSLLPMVSSRLNKAQVEFLPALRRGIPPSATISQLLSRFYLTTNGMNWRNSFGGPPNASLIDLPGIPFFPREFRAQYQQDLVNHGSGVVPDADIPPHIFLSKIVERPSNTNNHTSTYETDIVVLKDYILGHIVCGYALCPASVYHEMALSAVKDCRTRDVDHLVWSLSNVHYNAPLLYTEDSPLTVRTSIIRMDHSEAVHKFAISSYSENSGIDQQTIHCEGLVKARPRSKTAQKYSRQALALDRKKTQYQNQTASQEVFFTKAMYEKTFTRVVTYSPLYQAVQSIRINKDTDEAFAICGLQDPENTDNAAKATIVMDVLLHIAGFVANLSVDNKDVCICKEVKSAIIMQELSSSEQPFEVHCSTLAIPNERIIIADAYAVDSRGIFAAFKGMSFQEVKQAKLDQVFRHTATKLEGARFESNQANAIQPSAASLRSSSSRNTQTQSDTLQSPPSIRNIIATTCGVKPTSLSRDTDLKALGIDSLMVAELESNIQSDPNVQADLSTLVECETVGDIERLCRAEIPTTRLEHRNSEDSTMLMPNNGASVTSVIAETCGADSKSVMPNVALQTLGIDSLMIPELSTRLQATLGNTTLSSTELSEAQTVGDIERLVGAIAPYQRSNSEI